MCHYMNQHKFSRALQYTVHEYLSINNAVNSIRNPLALCTFNFGSVESFCTYCLICNIKIYWSSAPPLLLLLYKTIKLLFAVAAGAEPETELEVGA